MRWKLLAIDDEEDRTEQIADWFDPRQYDVIPAHSGPEGLDKARSLRPDIILLDIHMPGMDGLEVLEHLKRERTTAGIPVVIFSVKADDVEGLQRLMRAGLREGADYVVGHKWGLAALEQVVMHLLSESRQDRIVRREGHELRLGEGCKEVWIDGRLCRLPRMEAAVLEVLYDHLNNACRPEEIALAIGRDENWDKLDVARIYKLIQRLRRRIEPQAGTPILIVNVRGHGHKLAGD